MEIVIATTSKGKTAEIREILFRSGYIGLSLAEAGMDSVEASQDVEVFDSFEANAKAKAMYWYSRCGGRAVLAEDSGLCVASLDGFPGIRSRRWADLSGGSSIVDQDLANNIRLLELLEGKADRSAWYDCSAVLVWSGGSVSGSGRTMGRILEFPCGSNGFGYDPYFWSEELGACFGSVSTEEKALVSHRSRAIYSLLKCYGDVGGV